MIKIKNMESRTPINIDQCCERYNLKKSYFYKLLHSKPELRACGKKAFGKKWLFDQSKLDDLFLGSSISEKEIKEKAVALV